MFREIGLRPGRGGFLKILPVVRVDMEPGPLVAGHPIINPPPGIRVGGEGPGIDLTTGKTAELGRNVAVVDGYLVNQTGAEKMSLGVSRKFVGVTDGVAGRIQGGVVAQTVDCIIVVVKTAAGNRDHRGGDVSSGHRIQRVFTELNTGCDTDDFVDAAIAQRQVADHFAVDNGRSGCRGDPLAADPDFRKHGQGRHAGREGLLRSSHRQRMTVDEKRQQDHCGEAEPETSVCR